MDAANDKQMRIRMKENEEAQMTMLHKALKEE
jgi:hypothetical protein